MTRSSRHREPEPSPEVDVVAGIAAVVFPGLGHLIRGHTVRGIYAAVGVMGLFLGGLLIGGISVVDSRDARIWFVGQALCGPAAFGVDYLHQNHFKAWGPSRGLEFGSTVYRAGYPGEVREFDESTDRHVWRPPAAGEDTPGPDALPHEPAIGRVQEIGTLYGTLGGMLNLIVILDALFPGRARRRKNDTGSKKGGAA